MCYDIGTKRVLSASIWLVVHISRRMKRAILCFPSASALDVHRSPIRLCIRAQFINNIRRMSQRLLFKFTMVVKFMNSGGIEKINIILYITGFRNRYPMLRMYRRDEPHSLRSTPMVDFGGIAASLEVKVQSVSSRKCCYWYIRYVAVQNRCIILNCQFV